MPNTPLASRPHDHSHCVHSALAEADTLCARQGLRLAAHLWKRVRSEDEDGRYAYLRTHWHGDHTGTKNPTEELCRKWNAQHCRMPRKADVVNCSRDTALTAYRLGMLEKELQKVVDTCDVSY